MDFVGSSFIKLQMKMKKVKKALSKWSKEAFGNVFQEISEIVLLAQEIIRDMNRRAKNANVMVKLDMKKVYDRIS